MGVVIYPNLSCCPIYNGISILCYSATIFANENICSIKDIIGYIILYAICSIIRIYAI